MPTYTLGTVKAHVAAAANEVGPKFGIKTIYGFAAGQWDHPKGLALDFMINNIPKGKAAGDALSKYVEANHKRLGVTYIIWYKQTIDFRNNRGWHNYTGTSNPHTDHVHVSFETKPGSGDVVETGSTDTSESGGLLPDISWITDTGNWQRIGLVLLGGTLMTIAILTIPSVRKGITSVVKTGAKLAVTKGMKK